MNRIPSSSMATVPVITSTQINLISIPRTPVPHGFFQEEECTLLQLMVLEHPGLTSYKEN